VRPNAERAAERYLAFWNGNRYAAQFVLQALVCKAKTERASKRLLRVLIALLRTP
jgi:hypothetical protein